MDQILFSLRHAAGHLGMSVYTLRKRIDSGAIEAKEDGGKLVISAEELQRYAKALRPRKPKTPAE